MFEATGNRPLVHTFGLSQGTSMSKLEITEERDPSEGKNKWMVRRRPTTRPRTPEQTQTASEGGLAGLDELDE